MGISMCVRATGRCVLKCRSTKVSPSANETSKPIIHGSLHRGWVFALLECMTRDVTVPCCKLLYLTTYIPDIGAGCFDHFIGVYINSSQIGCQVAMVEGRTHELHCSNNKAT